MKTVFVSGGFDLLGSGQVRFLEEAAKLGRVHVGLWTDDLVQRTTGRPPQYPYPERRYLIEALRYVSGVTVLSEVLDAGLSSEPGLFPVLIGGRPPDLWAVDEPGVTPGVRALGLAHGLEPIVLGAAILERVPPPRPPSIGPDTDGKRVIVTGCFDWFHSGHVRFFEEAAAYGDLYVGVGSDINVRGLKGPGHPRFPEAIRVYMVQSVRQVKQAFVATGRGWLDAEPEIAAIKPHSYVVNEDGDRPEKRAFCARTGIAYVVLSRKPKPGLPRRNSTTLRGL
jgi:cytidyltransferase-like protein